MTQELLNIQSIHAKMIPVNNEYDKIANIFYDSYGSNNVCISVIYKIENPELEKNFNEQKKKYQIKDVKSQK